MARIYYLTGLVVAILLTLSLNASAALISGGVSDADIKARTQLDGAYGINFIDLVNPITGDGWLTSWSIYAGGTGEVKLIIFRANGPNYDVVGTSPFETISAAGKYTFTDLGSSGMAVKAGDYLGWYYPVTNSAGVISFDYGADNVAWVEPWGSQPEAATPWMYNFVQGRTYSINVSGSTVPLPPSVLLLGSGLMGLGLLRFRRKA